MWVDLKVEMKEEMMVDKRVKKRVERKEVKWVVSSADLREY